MIATIFTMVSSVSTSPEMERSMLSRVSVSISPTGVSERGVEDCKPAATSEAPERPLRLKEEGLLQPLSSSRSIALIGVDNWLPKDVSAINLVRGEQSMDPVDHGNVG